MDTQLINVLSDASHIYLFTSSRQFSSITLASSDT